MIHAARLVKKYRYIVVYGIDLAFAAIG